MAYKDSYERDSAVVLAGRLLANLALFSAILALAPSLFHLFASVTFYAFGFIIYVVVNIILIVLSLGFILFLGFPPIPMKEFFDGLTAENIFGPLGGGMLAFISVVSVLGCAAAVLAIILCGRKRGMAHSKAAVSRGIAAIVIIAAAVIVAFVSAVTGGIS